MSSPFQSKKELEGDLAAVSTIASIYDTSRPNNIKEDDQGPQITNDEDDVYTIVDIRLPLLIEIIASIALVWEVFMYFIIVTNHVLLTYGTFFTLFQDGLWDVIVFTDCLCAVDVIMRLGVEMWRQISMTNLVVFTLPYRFVHCILDLFSLFPLYVISVLFRDINSLNTLTTLDYFRLNSYIRLYRGYLFFESLEEFRVISEEVIFVMRFCNLYLAFINLVSCLFFVIIQVVPIDFLLWRNLDKLEDSWAKNFRNKKPDYGQEPWDLYILSTHFSTATVTTVGYGDVHGETEVEMMYCIFIMLFGAIFLNGYFTSQITNFQLELDGARFDLFFRLDAIKYYLTDVGMTPFFQSKVELYYKCLWTYREGVDRVSFVDLLPRSFQEDMYFDVCTEMFHKSFLFRDLDEAFLRAVSKLVKIALYNSDMILCRSGGYANQMYYILQGECQAMSKHDSSKTAAILRAGSLIGEMNLFFSCPYTVSVETNTCCQFISIDKEDLMACFNKFPVELNILRTRSQTKINQMYKYHEIFGEDPICWVQKRHDEEDHIDGGEHISIVAPPNCTARWGDGINAEVAEDVILDVDRFIIFETPCRNKKFKKNHVTPYMTCVIPEILNSERKWILRWNITIMIFALTDSFSGPYCLAFGASSQLERYVCEANGIFEYIIMVLFILDVVVEVLGACPVEGLYYQFHDGIQMKSREVLFYFDLLAAIPVEPFLTEDEQDPLHIVVVVLKAMKIWKVIRYLRFLDNVYPKELFWFRLAQTFIVLMYGIHFISCIMFYLACPTTNNENDDEIVIECLDSSWISSYKTAAEAQGLPVIDEIQPDTLGKDSPYLLSFYFSAATLTSAGFGDFNPQNIKEIIWAISFQLIGFFIIGYYTAVLTSALACTVKPRLEFQQKLSSVKRFMDYYDMPHLLLRRVVEHYELQHQLHNGVNLPVGLDHFLFDSPDYLKQDVLYTEVVLILDGIPLFSKTESKNIIKMGEVMKRYLIPPNVKFLHRGEVRRSMYAIRFGSIGVFDENSSGPQFILESTAYFGMRDLLFGEPAHHDYKTLSYCLLYEINHVDFLAVFEDDEELIEHLNGHKGEILEAVEEMCRNYSHLERERPKDRSLKHPSWVHFKDTRGKDDKMGLLRYFEYFDFFKEFSGSRFWRFFLMNGTVQPVGLFAKLWTSWMSLAACITLTLLVVETFTYMRSSGFRLVQWVLDIFFFIDIYVRMHWGYYLVSGLLVSHPLKTAGLYFFQGSFFKDVIICAPVELLMWICSYTSFLGYGAGAIWFTKLRWIRIFQIKRVPQMFKIIHSIFLWRNAVLFMLYVSMTVLVCTIVASIALYIGCPWEANNWAEGDENRLPFCLDHTWASTKFGGSGATSIDVMADFGKRWVVGIYYVCQVILVIGFGDMITLTRAEITLLIFMSVFGFIFMRCVIADITAAEVDLDEIRSHYVDQMKRLMTIMTRENVNQKLVAGVQEHLNHTWTLSKGLQPRELFADLHPALESDLYRSYVGDKLSKVPVFQGFATNVLRSICKYVKKLYCLKGERLARFGNLEYEMHIIISGKVWITDKQLNYGCTLHKNESFGETAVFSNSHSSRRYTVIAANNVEAFVITHADFQNIIDRYPSIKEVLGARTGNGHYDFFEYKIYDFIDWLKMLPESEKYKQMDILVERTSEIKKIVYNREGAPEDDEAAKQVIDSSRKDFRRRLFSYGSEDDNLPFIYFALQRSAKGKLTWWPPLIHPNCTLIRWYMQLIFSLCFIYPAVAVYEVCFIDEENFFKGKKEDHVGLVVDNISDWMNYCMLLFVILKFFMPFKDSDGKFVKNSCTIFVNYLTSIDGAIIDIICLAAGFIEVSQTADSNNFFTSRYFSLCIVLWLFKYYTNHFSKHDDLSISAFKYKISVSVSSFCLMAHILACIFYLIAECSHPSLLEPCKSDGLHGGNSWTHQFFEATRIPSKEDEGMKPWRWWVRSLYWVVTVISTTGFGDITPQNVKEMIIGIICVFSGAFILSIILSNFTAGMASLTKAHREYLYQVKLLIKYLRNIGLSNLRQEQINLYFQLAWNVSRGAMYHESLEILPSCMQIEVANALFEPVLKQVSFFNISDNCFIRQVSARVTHSMYLPGVCIVKEGDLGDNMYIVYKGLVSGVREEADTEELKSVYRVGDVFGKFPALFHDEWYKKSYRAEEDTEVLGLSQYDIVHLASIFTEFWTLLLSYVELNYEPNGGSDCIFIEPRTKARDLFDLGDDFRKRTKTKKNDHETKELSKKPESKLRKKKPHEKHKKIHTTEVPTIQGDQAAATVSGHKKINTTEVPTIQGDQAAATVSPLPPQPIISTEQDVVQEIAEPTGSHEVSNHLQPEMIERLLKITAKHKVDRQSMYMHPVLHKVIDTTRKHRHPMSPPHPLFTSDSDHLLKPHTKVGQHSGKAIKRKKKAIVPIADPIHEMYVRSLGLPKEESALEQLEAELTPKPKQKKPSKKKKLGLVKTKRIVASPAGTGNKNKVVKYGNSYRRGSSPPSPDRIKKILAARATHKSPNASRSTSRSKKAKKNKIK